MPTPSPEQAVVTEIHQLISTLPPSSVQRVHELAALFRAQMAATPLEGALAVSLVGAELAATAAVEEKNGS